MSLLTRLWLSAVLAMLLGWCGSYATNLLGARGYLEQQLFAQASDSASALALTLSDAANDAATRELLVSALFDSGHFESIVYADAAGTPVVERRRAPGLTEAPGWFARLLPLHARVGVAQVSDGWKLIGQVRVEASARYAYSALWRDAWHMAAIQAFVALMLGAVILLLMRWLQRPLRALTEQAEAIGRRQFELKPLPEVPELRAVGLAMNSMVERVRVMFDEQATRILDLRNEASRDPLTRLPSRSLLQGNLVAALSDEAAPPSGVLMLCRVLDLAGINRALGRERTDLLLVDCAELLRARLDDLDNEADARRVMGEAEALAGRLNGADFALLLPGQDAATGAPLAHALLAGFARLAARNGVDREPLAAIGWTAYRHGEQAGDVLMRADACLMQAESASPPLVGDAGKVAPGLAPASAQAWHKRLQAALPLESFELAFFPVLRTDGSLLHREGMLRLVDERGERLSAGQFMPAALREGLVPRLDLIALQCAVAELESHGDEIAVNLSALSLAEAGFVASCEALVRRVGTQASRLWIEVSERSVVAAGGVEQLEDFAQMLARHGVRFGIEHFGQHFVALPRLFELQIAYLKLDGAFVSEIDRHEGNLRFVRALVDVAGGMGIPVIAERVTREEEWHALRELGVLGLTGPAVSLR